MELVSATFAGVTESVEAARSAVAEAVGRLGIDPSRVVLLTSEVVSNAVQNVGGDLRVVVSLHQGVVRVEVHDLGQPTETLRRLIADPPRWVPPEQPRGRGLMIVRALATRLGLSELDGGGKVVWFEC